MWFCSVPLVVVVTIHVRPHWVCDVTGAGLVWRLIEFTPGQALTVAGLRYPITSGNFGTAGKISWSGMSSAVRPPRNSRGTRSVPDMHGDRLHAGITR